MRLAFRGDSPSSERLASWIREDTLASESRGVGFRVSGLGQEVCACMDIVQDWADLQHPSCENVGKHLDTHSAAASLQTTTLNKTSRPRNPESESQTLENLFYKIKAFASASRAAAQTAAAEDGPSQSRITATGDEEAFARAG